MNYSNTGLKMTAQFEAPGGKPVLVAYQDIVGVWTIGFGHTSGVVAGMTCTPDEAYQWLTEDVSGAEYVVNKVVTVPLTQNQFDACVDFVFNLGSGNFQGSTLLRKLNTKDYAGASAEFPKWNHAGGREVAGLTRRRLAEQQLFNAQ